VRRPHGQCTHSFKPKLPETGFGLACPLHANPVASSATVTRSRCGAARNPRRQADPRKTQVPDRSVAHGGGASCRFVSLPRSNERRFVPTLELLRLFARKGRRILRFDEHARIFDKYYARDTWIGGGSGSGSTPEATASYRDFLREFLRDNDIRSVLDLGCGDWQFSQLIDWTGIDYLGVDVSKVVHQNTKAFARPGIRFQKLNGTSSDLPRADLLIMKDVIQHWSNEDIERFLPNLSKFRYALITNGTHIGSRETNAEIRTGGCRPVDLTAAPFNVRGSFVYEFQADETKVTFLWRRDKSA
jgi:SAM-dependent methyltransferase